VIGALATSLIIVSLVCAVWALVLLFLSRPVGKKYLLGALAVIEAGLLGQSVAAVVEMIGTHGTVDKPTFVLYAVGILFILPVAGWWARTERSRWGVGVLLIGCLVVAIMVVRMNQVWSGTSV
jgi:hypothetical protein